MMFLWLFLPQPNGQELWNAAEANRSRQVNELLQQGAEVNWRDPVCGSTALGIACAYGSYEAAEVLCAHGAELDKYRDKYQITPLMYAAEEGHPKICAMLLALGADPSLKDEDGETALDKARNKPKCAALLQPVTPSS
eukprot:COSAG06_NODE_2447_length_6864_cov_3.888101_2_plen_138_part_00